MTFSQSNVGMMFKILALVLLITTFIGCKKDKEIIVAPISIEGNWKGNKGFGSETHGNDLLLTIAQGGIIEELNSSGQVKGSGTWTLNGTSFTAHYQFKPPLNTRYLLKGSYDKTAGKITGTWSFDDGDSDEGNWYINKK